jgi:hypothetical protein
MAMALGAARKGLRVASQRAGESQAAESMPDHPGLYVDGNTFLEKPSIKSEKHAQISSMHPKMNVECHQLSSELSMNLFCNDQCLSAQRLEY